MGQVLSAKDELQISLAIPSSCPQCPTGVLMERAGRYYCGECGSGWGPDPEALVRLVQLGHPQTWKKANAGGNRSHPETCPDLRAVTIEEFLKIEFPPRETVLHPWLPTQGLAMIHSKRGVGKTHVASGIAVAVAAGGQFLRWRAEKPRGVLFIDGEMPGVVMQERLARLIESMPKEPSAPLLIISPDLQRAAMPNLATPEGQKAIEPHLTGVELVIIDSISTLCRGIAENEADDWTVIQDWALSLRRRGISVLFIHHSGKALLQRGTSRREDILDGVINLKHPTDYHPEQGARFEVHYEKLRHVYGDEAKAFEAALITRSDGLQHWTMKDQEESLTERVAEMLNDGMKQNEIAKILKVSKGTVSKHKKKAQPRGLLSEAEKFPVSHIYEGNRKL